MPFSIDHVVIASDELDRAIVNARAAGFTVVPGGVHGSGNTHNALIGFADGSYLELFAPTPQGRSAEHRWFPRIRAGGGLVDFCLLAADLAAATDAIRQRGIAYSPPFAMSRLTPSGNRVEWLLSTPPGATGENGWPFFIEDTTPRAIRVPTADQARHRNSADGVAGISVLVRDLDIASKAYEAILGVAPKVRGDASAGALFEIAGAWIQVRSAALAGERQHLDRYGQGPYRLVLRGRGAEAADPDAGVLLDTTLFSGAQVAVASGAPH